jgi:hypothetical protein
VGLEWEIDILGIPGLDISAKGLKTVVSRIDK